MSDKEMFELAAKAAGIKIKGFYSDGTPFSDVNGVNEIWNPLTDDGDALRLAVKLNMHLHIDFDRPEMDVRAYTYGSDEEESGDDPYAATRRAIVRAAAEIGKSMKEDSK